MEHTQRLKKLAQQWVYENQLLLRRYRGEWIAYNGEIGIVAHGKDASKVMQEAEASGLWHVIKYLNPITYSGLRRIASIHFRPLHLDVWEPNVIIDIKIAERSRQIEMLVDSGADISTISLSVGEELGLKLFDNEVVDLAAGVNGTVEYVLRNVIITLEGQTFTAPVAWILNPNCPDLLLGREVIFDYFDIEFRQKDKEIVFKKRDDAPF
ncbi:MAG TPA: retropepsin-like domain-containing protein [Saprospiraceae bacterium]|nr:retropepsin-like domain-containing protein [Saprospiraceae bacterium]HMQ83468.1 retropepsin-like domain-containing protein [Saprospiraceae bacterium]